MQKHPGGLLRAALILSLSTLCGLAGVLPAAAAHVTPTEVDGNPDCGDLGFAIGFKVDPPTPGTYPLIAGPNTVFTGLSAPDPSNSFSFTSPDGIVFDWTSTLPLDVVIVKGGPSANVYAYDPEETSDTGLHSPARADGSIPAISHIEICYDYEVTVTKTAETSFTRTWEWSIDKSVTPEAWHLFTGDSGTSKYTITATKESFTDSDWAVEGEIVIDNATPFDATVTDVSDVITGGFHPAVDCGGAFPQVIAAGSSLTCSYGPVALPDGTSRTNTATVTTEGLVGGDSGEAAVEFTDPTTEVNDTIHVTDSNGPTFGPTSETTTWMYDRTFACSDDQGTHPNIATIDETGQSDSASVSVACYELSVTKDADTSFDRLWEWTVDKTADHDQLTLSPGQIFTVAYTVTVDATAADSNHAVEGNITVSNPNPMMAAPLTGVSDSVQGVAATVDCPALSVPAGGSLICTYSAALPDGTDRTNTATATLQNRSFDPAGNPTPNGTTDFSGNAAVVFGDPDNETDECVDVDDTHVGFLGTVCAGQAPAVFDYLFDIGPFSDPEDCGENLVDNTASFQTNDNGATGEDTWTVTVTVPCDQGCTLTPGYWKTHSAQGPAPFDDTWNQILPAAESSPFFLSGQTYLEVLWTPPQGNAYYILAHAWIATELNQLNGASIPADVLDAFHQGRTVFETYTPDEVDDFKGKDKDKRAMILGWAFLLDEYNNGITGPGHCSE